MNLNFLLICFLVMISLIAIVSCIVGLPAHKFLGKNDIKFIIFANILVVIAVLLNNPTILQLKIITGLVSMFFGVGAIFYRKESLNVKDNPAIMKTIKIKSYIWFFITAVLICFLVYL